MDQIKERLEKSYEAHQCQYEQKDFFSEKEQKLLRLKEIYTTTKEREFMNVRRYEKLKPLLDKEDEWLTIGDHYGEEAKWLTPFCKKVLPADINITYLELAQQEKYIKAYSQQNVEKMTFEDNTFDFILCRESYHHFPRPYIAVYEMLRCVKKGVVITEPLDMMLKMPFLLFLCNILDTKKAPKRSAGIWKNRFSFETVGNYIYKVSPREFEKIAMGIGLPAVAFHYSNDSCVNLSSDIKKTNRVLRRKNLLSKMKIIPYQTLTAVLFKEMLDETTKTALRENGYFYYELPQNPYL